MIAATVVGYLIFILSMNVVMRVYLLRDLWVRVARTVTVHEVEAVNQRHLARELFRLARGERQ